ncbi:response regulator transcription factor [Pedobacter polaris]|uniref:Response regulator transcription factor n=1 Tax=Pedobacter polaris TaxID=2571273 RepID=A0A4V5P1M1_9SPHI|nr:LytTR family DNA-binding domain-containing protein [Pedobacter polaris]TKC12052.1 response regulator transcription factor [Pedobacter polaris]
MISCYILSEPSSMHTLKKYIEWFQLTTLNGQALPNPLGLSSVIKDSPHILFVDISLASTHKATLLEIGQKSTIIYIANCYSHAYDAFDTLGFDFLMMPLTFARFEMSMNKFMRFSSLAASDSLRKEEPITNSFFVKADSKGQKEVLVRCKDVIFIEALQNYVVLHMVHDKKLICHNTMKEMEECLPEEFFIRVHKSFIIHYDKVTSIEGNNIVLNDNENYKILIGGTYKKLFSERKNQKMIKKKNYLQTFDYSITASICLFYSGLMLNCIDLLDLTLLNFI